MTELAVGEGADLQAALARVVIGGLVASTFVTLFPITSTSRRPIRSARARAALSRWLRGRPFAPQ